MPQPMYRRTGRRRFAYVRASAVALHLALAPIVTAAPAMAQIAVDRPQLPPAPAREAWKWPEALTLPTGIQERAPKAATNVAGGLIAAFVAAFFMRKRGRVATRRTFFTVALATLFLNLAHLLLGRMPALPAGVPSMAWWGIAGIPAYMLATVLAPAPRRKASAPGIGTGTHGSAHFGTVADMQRFGHLYAPGVTAAFALGRANVGRDLDPRFRHMGHILTCAPTGSGKGIGAVIPTLLEYPGSTIVLDIKGENYAITHQARRAMGHEVFLVDPFGVTGDPTAGFNWLDMLHPTDPDVVGESATLADMLVVPDPHAEQHWDEAARNLLQGIMIHVASSRDEARRHMGEVRRLLTGTENDLLHLLAEMSLSTAGFGLVARSANTFTAKAEKERSGVLSAAIKHTAFLDDPRIVAALSRSDFDLADLKYRPMTVYVVLPPSRLAAYGRFMRGFVGQALAGITSSEHKAPAPVLFLLDEFAQLGHMKAVEDAVSLVRGYGAFFWLIVQDLSQLKGVYPRWQTFLANTAKQFFGTADFDTAKYISDSLGQRTVQFTTASQSSSTSYSLQGGGSSGHSVGEQHTGRSLLMPDEVMALGPLRPVVLISGEPPYVLHRINYLTDPEYAGRFAANPYHAGTGAVPRKSTRNATAQT